MNCKLLSLTEVIHNLVGKVMPSEKELNYL